VHLSTKPSTPILWATPIFWTTSRCYTLQQAVAGKGQVSVPFQLSDLKEIKKDLDSYADNLEQYIQAFITVIQTFELAWKAIMLLLDQTPSSSEKQWVLGQAT
jgi:hypothetical protein